MITLVLDHLWQSTLFAGGCGLLTLLLAGNAARVRFWLWFAASMKFLVPFAALAALGARLLPHPARAAAAIRGWLAPAAEPYVMPAANIHALAAITTHPVMRGRALKTGRLLLLAVWAVGTLAITLHWLSRWLKLRAALSGAARRIHWRCRRAHRRRAAGAGPVWHLAAGDPDAPGHRGEAFARRTGCGAGA